MVEESVGKFSNCHQICWSVNLPAEGGGWGESDGKFSDGHQICQSANMLTDVFEGTSLLADLVIVRFSASQ